jgi:N-acetylmuramoyl-L-alanine amidase
LNFSERPSPNFDARAAPISLVVLHYTGMQSAEVALARLCDPAPVAGRYPGPWQAEGVDPDAPLGRASAHYCVAEDGTIFRLVDEEKRAWHAGASSWRGQGDMNDRSIGIEIVNGGHDFGLPDFPGAQIKAVIALLQDILARRKLPPDAVVAHSDIAPARKQDPGERFPWRRLAEAGVAIWPGESAPAPEADVAQLLKRFGYGLEAGEATCLAAFQRRFRPARVDGAADSETRALLAALRQR